MLLIKNGNLITMAGMYEQTGDILIDDGKIVKVGQVGEVPEDCQVIDAAGRTVTPGLVDAHCHAGLWGTACREEMDGNEYTEPVLPGLRGLDAINPEDATFDAALRQGITTVVTGPGSSNIVGGTFLAIKTAGEDMESPHLPGAGNENGPGRKPEDDLRKPRKSSQNTDDERRPYAGGAF